MSIDWGHVGDWIVKNAGSGAALIGSLVTGNVPGAVSAGISMIQSATGSATPDQALETLQKDPQTIIRLKEIAAQEQESIREHLRTMHELDLKDQQSEHITTQTTIMAGDKAEDPFVRRTRPMQSWLSLIAAIAYSFAAKPPDSTILVIMMSLSFAYFGLRTKDKITAATGVATAMKQLN